MKKYKKLSKIILIITICILTRYLIINSTSYKIEGLYEDPIKVNQTYNNYGYNEYKNYIEILFWEGTEKELVIPEKINNKKVYSIDDSAFYGNEKLQKVTVSRYVIRIGHQAFIGNNNLKEVILPDNIIDISDYTFDVCPKLEKIYVKRNSKTDKTLKKTKFYKYVVYR